MYVFLDFCHNLIFRTPLFPASDITPFLRPRTGATNFFCAENPLPSPSHLPEKNNWTAHICHPIIKFRPRDLKKLY